jgi:hypothetical protein
MSRTGCGTHSDSESRGDTIWFQPLRSALGAEVIAPLKALCTSDEFEQLARNSAPERKLIDVITPSNEGSFRQSARLVEQLVDPVMEELHKLEGDQPLLSRMFPVITQLLKHAETFIKDHPQLASTHGVDALRDITGVSISEPFQRLLHEGLHDCSIYAGSCKFCDIEQWANLSIAVGYAFRR